MSQKEQLPSIVIQETEHKRLLMLAESIARGSPLVYEYLSRELARAQLVPESEIAEHIVRAGSHVTYRDEKTGKLRRVILCYPIEADVANSRISIVTPIGAALLGMSRGQTIDWPSPDGELRALTVIDVQNDRIRRDIQ